MKKRIYWVDAAKCLGMFAIYLGHCGEAAGELGTFLHTHHVALFFLLSGCMENLVREPGILKTAEKVCKRILLPWLVFCVLSLACVIVTRIGRWPDWSVELMTILQGTIRGRFLAGGLWFLTCLAVVRLMFALLRKLKYKPLILLAAAYIYYRVQMTRVPSPIIWATLPFNLDSACCYLLYYAIGYAVFHYADRALNPETKRGKVLLGISGGAALAYGVLVYLGWDPLATAYADQYVLANMYALLVHPVLRALILIWLYFVAAKLLEGWKLLRDMGANSLYLCGGEFLAKEIAAFLASFVGIALYPRSPLTSIVYSGGMLLLTFFALVPLEKWLMAKLKQPRKTEEKLQS